MRLIRSLVQRKGSGKMYEIKHINGHYEIYIDGEFYCSADTLAEAAIEIDNHKWHKLKEEMYYGCPLRGR